MAKPIYSTPPVSEADFYKILQESIDYQTGKKKKKPLPTVKNPINIIEIPLEKQADELQKMFGEPT